MQKGIMDQKILKQYEGLRRRLARVRTEAAIQNVDHVSSVLKMSKEIGIGLSALNWFINNTRDIRLKTFGLISRYVIRMEKELGIIQPKD